MFLTIIVFIIILGLLVFVHEFGHFITAKKSGCKVEEFGFGFPPRLFGIKKGETIYSLNWIPLGGFVKIKGESGENREEQDSFAHQKIWKRAIVLFSGVGMNFLLAVFLFSLGFMIGLPQVIEGDLGSTKVRDLKIQIVAVLEGSPAYEAGLKIGDEILSLDNQSFAKADDLSKYISHKLNKSIEVKWKRGSEEKVKKIIPLDLQKKGQGFLGVGLADTGLVSYPFYQAFWQGIKLSVFLTKAVVLAFYDLLKGLIIDQKVGIELSGPVGIAVLTGQVARMGIIYIIQFTALLSINLAIINFIPFPALDGGRMLFLLIEWIRGKPVSQRIESLIHNLGFAFLMLLVLLVTFRDLSHFGGGFAEWINKIIK